MCSDYRKLQFESFIHMIKENLQTIFTSSYTIINVSLYNYLHFVYFETPSQLSFLFFKIYMLKLISFLCI